MIENNSVKEPSDFGSEGTQWDALFTDCLPGKVTFKLNREE